MKNGGRTTRLVLRSGTVGGASRRTLIANETAPKLEHGSRLAFGAPHHEAIEAAPLEAALAKQETGKCTIKSFHAMNG
jgi:hypothetical protein